MTRAALALPLLLAACAQAGPPPPSLLPRAVEKLRVDDPPVEAPGVAATAISPDTQAAIARLLSQANDGEAVQLRVLAANRGALGGRRAAEGSEAWIAAQTALSALEVARLPTLDALTEIDRLEAAADQPADQAALAAARVRVQAIIERQDARLR